MMELQYSGRATPSTMEEEEVLEREKEATKGQGMKSLLSPTIYRRAKGEGAGPRRSNLLGGAAKGRNPSSPRHLGGAFPF